MSKYKCLPDNPYKNKKVPAGSFCESMSSALISYTIKLHTYNCIHTLIINMINHHYVCYPFSGLERKKHFCHPVDFCYYCGNWRHLNSLWPLSSYCYKPNSPRAVITHQLQPDCSSKHSQLHPSLVAY